MSTIRRMVFNRLEIGSDGIARQKVPPHPSFIPGRRTLWELLDDDDLYGIPVAERRVIWELLDDDAGDLASVSATTERMMREYIDNMLRYDGIRASREEVLHGRTDNT